MKEIKTKLSEKNEEVGSLSKMKNNMDSNIKRLQLKVTQMTTLNLKIEEL